MNSRLLGSALAALALTGCSINVSPFGAVQPLEETVVFGERGPKIVMIELEGVLGEARGRGALLGPRPSDVARVREALDLAADDDDVVGLLLRINSPGGTASASETLYHEVERWKGETGKPVAAYFQGLAASGGYYVAMAADHITAHPATVTGSIGAIMFGVNLSGLMEKVGVADQTFTSDEFKDAGSPLRAMRPEEREQIQSVVDDLAARFREVVEKGRPKLDSDDVARLADGRIYSAPQALEAGLIDAIGHLEDAVATLEQRLQLEESRVVVYHRPSEYRTNLYTRSLDAPLIDVDVLTFELGERLPVGFYYIWPPALGLP